MNDDGLAIAMSDHGTSRRKFWEQVYVSYVLDGQQPVIAAKQADEALTYWDNKWT